MPVMDGETATSALRRAGYAGVIIGITGDVGTAERQRMIAAGADTVMAKPVCKADLTAVLLERFCS